MSQEDAESSDMNSETESDADLTTSFDSANVSNLGSEDSEDEVKLKVTRHCGKKQRKCRTSFSKSQLDALEQEFQRSNFITKDRLDHLLTTTGLEPAIIKVGDRSRSD